jgi:hypothetical protein
VLNAGPNDAYRFNWNTPLILSPHNPSIVWLGGNRLFKSYNRGDTWIGSQDLTKNIDRNTVALLEYLRSRAAFENAASSPTAPSSDPGITCAAGAPKFGTGYNAGQSRVGCDICRGCKAGPGCRIISIGSLASMRRSSMRPPYVAVDGHRSDDLKSYLFVTHDYGAWTSVASNLPTFGNIQVVARIRRTKIFMSAASSVSSHRPMPARPGTGS